MFGIADIVDIVVKVKLLYLGSLMPKKAHPDDSGFDLYALEDVVIPSGGHVKIPTGVAFELPKGYEMQLRGRSGLAGKGITAHHGTVDQNFRGEVAVHLYNHNGADYQVKAGDRVCQAIIKRVPGVKLVEVRELAPSDRGDAGFGSTGR